jgi:hypothetical protein
MTADWKQRTQTGHRHTQQLALQLLEHGIPLQITPLTYGQPADYTDEADITLWPETKQIILEQKSRTLTFTNPQNYPYPTIYLTATKRHNNRPTKPHAYIITSQHTNKHIVVPTRTQPHWQTTTVTDRARNLTYTALEAPANLAITLTEYLQTLTT